MQYEIPLPADYDMDIIRRRVATRGASTDDFPGLGIKAYLIRGTVYAPFYLWNDAAGMNRFLWGGGGFENIVRDFWRPPVRHWIGLAFRRGPAFGEAPTAATRVDAPIDDPSDFVDPALHGLAMRAKNPDVHSTALVVDPFTWTLTHFTLRRDAPPGSYEVLHLSEPGLEDLGDSVS
nr:DUF4865 family protein [Cryptosporangium phraense]